MDRIHTIKANTILFEDMKRSDSKGYLRGLVAEREKSYAKLPDIRR